MNVKELKEIIKDLPDDMPVEPGFMDDYGDPCYRVKLDIEVMKNEDFSEETLVIMVYT
jgi:hypothetical protein